MRKTFTKLLVLPLIASMSLTTSLFSCSNHEEDVVTHQIYVEDQDGGTNYSISPSDTYVDEDLTEKFYVGITNSTEDWEIVSVTKVWIEVDGQELDLIPNEDYTTQNLRLDKIQIKNFNLSKLKSKGDLHFLIYTKYIPPQKKHSVIIDTQDVTADQEIAVEGSSFLTELSLNSGQDKKEIDAIEYVKIGENPLTPRDFVFTYSKDNNSTLEIPNGSLISDDIHIAVRVVDKSHLISVTTEGPSGIEVVSSQPSVPNRETLNTKLSINIKSNSMLVLGEIHVSIGQVELTEEQFIFDVDWLLPTMGDLKIDNPDLIKDDIFIDIKVESMEPEERPVFFSDGLTKVKSPYTASNISGYYQASIQQFFYDNIYDDKTKQIKNVTIDVEQDSQKTRRLVEGIDYEFNNNTLTISQGAVEGNLLVTCYSEYFNGSDFTKDSWDHIIHYIDASRALPDTNEKDYLLQLYKPENDSFVGLTNENEVEIGEAKYKFMVIGQEEDEVCQTDPFYKEDDPTTHKAFLTLQVAQNVPNIVTLIPDDDYIRYIDSSFLWDDDNPVKQKVSKVEQKATEWQTKHVRTVKKQRYIHNYDSVESTEEKFFFMSWSEFGKGKNDSKHDILTKDGHNDGASYSYYSGSSQEVAEKRKKLFFQGGSTFIGMATPAIYSSSDYSYYLPYINDETGNGSTWQLTAQVKHHFDLLWCLCI